MVISGKRRRTMVTVIRVIKESTPITGIIKTRIRTRETATRGIMETIPITGMEIRIDLK
jgi:hypothetical protein